MGYKDYNVRYFYSVVFATYVKNLNTSMPTSNNLLHVTVAHHRNPFSTSVNLLLKSKAHIIFISSLPPPLSISLFFLSFFSFPSPPSAFLLSVPDLVKHGNAFRGSVQFTPTQTHTNTHMHKMEGAVNPSIAHMSL